MSTFNPAGGGTYNLGASVGSTDTTILLSSFKVPVSGADVTMALMNTDIVYGTIAPRTSSSEFISFTGITQNANGTATLTGVTRGLNKTSPFTASSTFRLPHSGQSVFILSDAPQVFNKYMVNENAETVTGVKTFATGATPKVTDAPLTSTEVVNKAYADALVIAGAPDSSTSVKGIGRVSVAPVAPTTPIFVGDNDGRVPIQSENDALQGTSGTPSNTNRYVTQEDDRVEFSVTQNGAQIYAADGGGTDAYAVTLSPVPASYATGMVVNFKANTANTGTATLNVNGLGVKTIKKNVSTDLSTGDIIANQIVEVIYDGTNFQLQSPVAQTLSLIATGSGDFLGSTSLVSAHGLGVTPKLVRVSGYRLPDSGAAPISSNGSFNGTTQNFAGWTDVSGDVGGISGTDAVLRYTNSGGTNRNVTLSMDATNLTFTSGDSGTNSWCITWEAFA